MVEPTQSGARTATGQARVVDQAWTRILRRLTDNRDELVEDFMLKLSESGHYASYDVADDDLRRTAADAMDLLIGQLAGDQLPPTVLELPLRVGTRRARQGIDRERLIEAVRLNFRVLWAGLLRASGPDAAEVLVQHTEDLLTIVERYASDIQVAFMNEMASLTRETRSEAVRAFSRLLSAGSRVETVGREVAPILGFSLNGRFEVAAVATADAAEGLRRSQQNRQGPAISWDFEDSTVFVREVHRVEGLPVDGLRGELSGLRGGYLPAVQTVFSIPVAVERARIYARHASAHPGWLATEEDIWPALAASQVRAALPSLEELRAKALGAVGDDRDRILQTAFQYAQSGSVKATSERLFCHRNTVVNRLNVLRDITGLDMTVPAEAARALLAFGDEYSMFLRASTADSNTRPVR